MRPAPETLKKVGVLVSSRALVRQIARRTGERLWEVLHRLIVAEWERLNAERPFRPWERQDDED